jgi:glycosyltransferase involved in cell wall biosynthesis
MLIANTGGQLMLGGGRSPASYSLRSHASELLEMSPRVAYWNNIPAPYVVDRFNAVARRGNVDLEAWFSYPTEPGRSWTVDERGWHFPYRWLPRAGPFAVPSPLLSRHPPDLLISLYGWPWFVVGFVLARLRGTRRCFEVEVTSDTWVRRRPWKEAAKRYLLTRADAVITVGDEGERYAVGYGADPSRCVRVTHSIGAVHFSPGSRSAGSRREQLRAELGVEGTAFLYAGRFWRGKGVDFLLEAYRVLRRNGAAASLVLAGAGEDEAQLRRRVHDESIPGVVFAGFREGLELVALYHACDAFVFPTLGDPWGLVVEEAMVAGLPVVVSGAAGEIRSRVRDGETGYIVPTRDVPALIAAMQRLLEPEHRRRLGEAARDSVPDRTPERWAEHFEHAVARIMAFPPR